MYMLRVTLEGCLCFCIYLLKIRSAQLSCLGGSVGRTSAQYAGCHEFKSRLRQLMHFFSGKKELSSSVAALRCLVPITEFPCTYMYMNSVHQ